MRGKRSALAFVAAGLVLAQVAGCGSCVKDDPPKEQAGGRKPINLRAADKRFSQYTDGSSDASTD
jgi:hypothetical protein